MKYHNKLVGIITLISIVYLFGYTQGCDKAEQPNNVGTEQPE